MVFFPNLTVPKLLKNYFLEVDDSIPRRIYYGQWGAFSKENPKWIKLYSSFRKMVYRIKKTIKAKLRSFFKELCPIVSKVYDKLSLMFNVKPYLKDIKHTITNKDERYSYLSLVIDFVSDLCGFLCRRRIGLWVRFHTECLGRWVAKRSYAIDVGWSNFGVESSCRVWFKGGDFINFDCSSSPEHNERPHKPHVEFSDLDLLVDAVLLRLQGFTGHELFKRLGAKKISSYGGRGHVPYHFWTDDGLELVLTCSKNVGLQVVNR